MIERLSLFICVTLCSSIDLSSQDLITKLDSTQLEVRILEVNKEYIYFREFNNSASPIDSISINEVFNINVEEKDEAILDSTLTQRQGIHLGLSFIPTYGKYGDGSSYSSNASIDVDFYFTNKMGLRTGFRYSSFNFYYDVYYYTRDSSGYFHKHKGNINGSSKNLGIPFKFIYTTQKRLAFFIEAGVVVYFYDYSNATRTVPVDSQPIYSKSDGLNLSWDIETSLGLDITLKEKTNLKLGLFGGFAPFSGDISKYFIGAQIGATYRLGR